MLLPGTFCVGEVNDTYTLCMADMALSDPLPRPPPVPLCQNRAVTLPSLDPSLSLTPDKPVRTASILKKQRRERRTQRQVHFQVSEKAESVRQLHRTAGLLQGQELPGQIQRKGSTGVKEDGMQKVLQQRRLCEVQQEPSCPLSTGELNTTLALRVELQGLSEEMFDLKKAVEQQLKTSSRAKSNIVIRATEGVNIPRSQHLYHSLVSVNVTDDQLISQAVQDRLLLSPHTHTHTTQEHPAEGPDILAFYSHGELLHEAPLLPGEELRVPRSCPVPRPSQAAFDLYHKLRQWES